MSEQEFADGYLRYVRHKVVFISAALAALAIAAGASCLVDGRPIGILDVYRIIWEHLTGARYEYATPEYWDDFVVCQMRLPRTVLAIVAGSSLAVCGTVMQSIMSNPLADPYTTGMSSGACLGSIIAIAMGFAFTGPSIYGIVGMSFLMALVPAFVVILASRLVNTSPATLILMGTIMSYLFSAVNTLILVNQEGETLSAAYLWTIGSLDNVIWSDLWIPGMTSVLGCAAMLAMSGKLNVMMMGDDQARSMGLDVDNFRTVLLLVLSVMVASIISFTGILGFVGLVAPHIVRMAIGSDNKFVIPASMAFGSALLLVTDTVARLVVYPYEIPVGIVLMFIGGPLFLYVVVRKKGYGGIY
ncbi:MAG: iron ABC transporter permease [Candidatus Methanomethylophilaceae archaeon]|nr:iron ABC transporter permease [Candidatus Methanomethylophilaceae archaeon]